MRPLSRILLYVPENGSRAAIQAAVNLARDAKATLTVADVFDDTPTGAGRFDPRGWKVAGLVRAEKQTRLDRAAARIRGLGEKPRTLMLSGSPVDALVHAVTKGRYDLVVVDTSGADGNEASEFSVSGLIRECPCPVLVARPSRRRRRARVLVALNPGATGSRKSNAMNRTLLDAAISFAEIRNGEVHALYVWTLYGERAMRRGGLGAARMHELIDEMREQAGEDLANVIAPYRAHIPPDRLHLQKGDPKKEIARFASAHRFDLLVIGTAGRAGLVARVIGNTAEAVVASLPCSMAIVKPARRSRRIRRTSR